MPHDLFEWHDPDAFDPYGFDNIAFVIHEDRLELKNMKDLHTLVGGSLMAIRQAMLARQPVLTLAYPDNNWISANALMRRFVLFVQKADIQTKIYLLQNQIEFDLANDLCIEWGFSELEMYMRQVAATDHGPVLEDDYIGEQVPKNLAFERG
ncbi:MAG: hypothetical protein AAFX02_10680 [Pseudomonadota bacterium]